MSVIDLKSSYKSLLQQYDGDKNKIADWEEALTGLKNAATDAQSALKSSIQTAYGSGATQLKNEYQQNITSANTQTSYDISRAYENFKNSQLRLLQNNILTTGSKQQALSDLSEDYSTAVKTTKASNEQTTSALRNKYLRSLGSLQTQYKNEYAEELSEIIEDTEKYKKQAQEELEKEASTLADTERALWAYRGINDMAAAENAGYITTSGELTDTGRDFLAKALLDQNAESGETLYFGDYLAKNNPELFEYFSGNQAKIMQLVGGLTAEDVGKTYSQSSVYTEQNEKLRKEIEEQISPLTEAQRLWFENETGVSLEAALSEGTTPSEKRSALNTLKETVAKIPEHRQNEAIKVNGGYIYNNQKYKTTHIGNSSKTANDITRELDLKKKIKSGEVQYGDVVQWKGNYYVVLKGDNAIPRFEQLRK